MIALSRSAGTKFSQSIPPHFKYLVFLGKMVVYKSGKIKLKLGNCMMDVSLAKSGTFAQSLAAVNLADNR